MKDRKYGLYGRRAQAQLSDYILKNARDKKYVGKQTLMSIKEVINDYFAEFYEIDNAYLFEYDPGSIRPLIIKHPDVCREK